MTGVASDHHLAAGEIGVDFLRHLDHVPRDIFFWIVVAREVSLDMAEIALHAQSGSESPHDLVDFVAGGRLQDFQVGRIGAIGFFLLLLLFLFFLSGKRQQAQQKQSCDDAHGRMVHLGERSRQGEASCMLYKTAKEPVDEALQYLSWKFVGCS